MPDKVYWTALADIPQIGGKSITRLLSHFGSLGAIFEADTKELLTVRGIGPEAAARIRATDLEAVLAALAAYKAEGIQLISWDEPTYPAELLKTDDAPALLFVKGELLPSDARAAAIIGTRKPTPASQQLAERIAHSLVVGGWAVVSGLAYGIDTAAHQSALGEGGRTLAVLGGGLRQIYPAANARLAERICQQGALIAEVPPDRTVSPQNLAARNRITSGLSQAVIIVQSERDSGSLITARHAFRQGRPILTIASAKDAASPLAELDAVTLDPDTFDLKDLGDILHGIGRPIRTLPLPGFDDADR